MESKRVSTRVRWQKHIEKFETAGLTQTRYCEKNGLCLSTFQYWKRRLREEATGTQAGGRSRFIELPSFPIDKTSLENGRPVIEISLGSDLRLRGRFDFDLSRIIREMIQ